MQFQYVLIALLASANYVLAVPAADVQDTAELTSVPDGVSVINAAQKADNEVIADGADTPA
ncbi:hypothetical protein VE03_08635 [Pseudogymnoascus sp. 23342-1-I1]|nr:hypothetical protein VE03_08635 [Pseudogymnoascus sp. 23342-1-I1]